MVLSGHSVHIALHALVPDASISFTSSSGISGFSGTFQHGTDARGSFSFLEIVSKEELVEVWSVSAQ